MTFCQTEAAARTAAAALLFCFLSLPTAVAPPGLAAQGAEVPGLGAPPDSRLVFVVSASDPMLEPLLTLHGCRVPENDLVLTLPGRVFDPPLVLRPDADAGRSDPTASLSTQWAHLAAGDVERATAGWAPEERAIAAALLEDPATLERYRDEAGGIDSATVEAVAWIEPGASSVAVLLSASNLTGFPLGMPAGYLRTADEGFLLSVAIARDPRFAIVGAAAMAGTYGPAEEDQWGADGVSFADVCSDSEAGGE